MSGNRRKSLVVKEMPTIYVPEFLRSPVRIRRFWYVRLWDYPRALWRGIFKTKPKKATPALSVEGGAE